MSRSGRQKYRRPILMKADQGSYISAIHLPSVSPVSLRLPFHVTGGEVANVGSVVLWWHGPFGYDSSSLRGQLMFWPLVPLWYFGDSFVRVAVLFAGDWLMSPQFESVHLPQWPITDQFHYHLC